jgi:hypothetical protein
VHRKGACYVRWGGVGALEQSRPGLLPDKGHRWSAFSSHAVREMRRARVVLSVTCRCEATGVTAGERSDTETVMLREARGDWKRAIL